MSRDITKTVQALSQNDEERMLLTRVSELTERAEDSNILTTDFLNLGEQVLVCRFLTAMGKKSLTDYYLWGGYPFAERKILYLLPEYVSSYAQGEEKIRSVCEESALISALSVKGSGYVKLGHRDYLGAMLALGTKRQVLGDIVIPDEYSCTLLLKSGLSDYYETNLTQIGRDHVRVSTVSDGVRLSLPDYRKTESISDTVASVRLDALVASFAGLSREKAKSAVTQGLIELDFRVTTAPDLEVADGSYISIRGVGRFLYEGVDGTSKKGRLRIHAKRFV